MVRIVRSRIGLSVGLAVVLVLSGAVALRAGDSSGKGSILSEVSNLADFSDIMQAGLHHWNHGYFVFVGPPGSTFPGHPGVVAYDREGRVAREANVWPEGARTVSLGAGDVSQSGTLVVSGGTMNNAGEIANFIAEIGEDNQVRRMVRTNPFVATYVCAQDDGTVWAYGFDREASRKSTLLLRQHSFEKGQIQEMLTHIGSAGRRNVQGYLASARKISGRA